MNSEFFAALEELEKKTGIPHDYMLEKIEAALVAAYKKEYGNNTNVRVLIDPNKKDVRVYQQKTVVAEVENPEIEIMILGAQDVITTSGARGEANCSKFNETPDW